MIIIIIIIINFYSNSFPQSISQLALECAYILCTNERIKVCIVYNLDNDLREYVYKYANNSYLLMSNFCIK